MKYEGKQITKDELKQMVEEVFRREDKKDRRVDILKYATPEQRELVNKILKKEVERQLGEYKYKELLMKEARKRTEIAEGLRTKPWWEDETSETYKEWTKIRNTAAKNFTMKNKMKKNKNKQ